MRWRQWLALLIVLAFISTSAFAAGVAAERSGIVPGAVRVQPPELVDRFSVFWQAWGLVHDHFVARSLLDDRELTYGAVQGMVSALGDGGHTRFLPPDEATIEMGDLSGKFEGIGAQLGERNGFPVIVAPLDGSPAERAGVQAGDVIVNVDGQPVAGLTLDRIVGMIRGPKGTTVRITVLHPGESSLTELTIQRDTIPLHSVSWAMIPGTKAAHLRISQFSANAKEELLAAIKEARSAGAEGLVVDVRRNPGGQLDQAISVSSQFLTSGNVLIEQDADGNREPMSVEPGGVATDLPLVTLIDLGTASAAEIFAGAMQDHKRGPVVGETSFGTGTVLSPFALSDGSVLLLGTSQWLTPSGRQIWKQGIVPDVMVPLPAGAEPLTPAREKEMTAEQVLSSGDAQVLKAIELLTR